MPGGQKARLVPPLCRLKAQEYHTGTKHMEQDNRQGGGLPSEPVSCLPVQPSPTHGSQLMTLWKDCLLPNDPSHGAVSGLWQLARVRV